MSISSSATSEFQFSFPRWRATQIILREHFCASYSLGPQPHIPGAPLIVVSIYTPADIALGMKPFS